MLDQSLTRPGLLAATEDIAVLAARCASDAETQRRLDQDVVKTLLSAGFARHFVPVSCGGNAATFGELAWAVSKIGEACAATA
jgi:alkylation response protein AidB-like acyl-CoA dehydrogenase